VRIAYVYDVIHPYVPGGVQKRIWELSRRLVTRGHSVTVFGMKHWEGEDVVWTEGVRLWGVCPPRDLFVNGRRSIGTALYFGRKALPALQQEQFDIIDCQNFPYFPCFSAKIASVVKHSPLLITWHEVWGKHWDEYLGRKGPVGKVVERLVGRLSKVNLTGTRHNFRGLISIGVPESRIKLISIGGISLDQIQEISPASEKFDVVFAGRLVDSKGPETLVRAMHRLKEGNVNATAVIVGDGPEREKLEALSRELSIQDTVRFLGRIEDDNEVISVVKSARLFVYPACPEGGWSISIIEANACGLPAVSVKTGPVGTNEVVIDGYNGLLVERESAEAIAEKIKTVLQSEQLRGELSKNAIAFAREQDWDYLVDKMADCYSQAALQAS
jgi:glycosyltransferase involved in cell wall biosynthesis